MFLYYPTSHLLHLDDSRSIFPLFCTVIARLEPFTLSLATFHRILTFLLCIIPTNLLAFPIEIPFSFIFRPTVPPVTLQANSAESVHSQLWPRIFLEPIHTCTLNRFYTGWASRCNPLSLLGLGTGPRRILAEGPPAATSD